MKTHVQNEKEMKDEPKDICCICSRVAEAGTMQDVNAVDFELLCDNCKDKRCSSCDSLRANVKFGDLRYSCSHRGCIDGPKKKVCEYYNTMTCPKKLSTE